MTAMFVQQFFSSSVCEIDGWAFLVNIGKCIVMQVVEGGSGDKVLYIECIGSSAI